MESIVIHPKSAEQLKTVRLPNHVISGIEKSLGQQEAGQLISLQEFKQKHFSK